MRNPKRIPEIMSVIQEIWEKQPDTRFNQLVHNLQAEFHSETGIGQVCHNYSVSSKFNLLESNGWAIDLFNVEDDTFLLWLQKKL